VLAPAGVPLIAGGPYALSEGDEAHLNSAFLVSASGDIRARYDKQRLLPFAEYFPFGGIDLLRRNFGRVREFTPGGDPVLLDTPIGPAGVMICNEGFFAEPAAERVRAGATLLVNLANDSWLADPKFSEPAFEMVVLRAIEQRRWIIRASTAGPSALVDPFGRVVARGPLLSEAIVTGAVAARTEVTPYDRAGDAFAWSCLAIALAATLLPGGRRDLTGAPRNT
jgi:apolipoprotein N-acyltransferase